jgi:chorismate dehydratase
MTPRISASSYSNTAPLIWSFLYGSNHGKVELILDNAPARSAELLAQDRVDAALVPVIASQFIDGVKLVPNVCVGAKQKVRSVCLVTKGDGLENVKSVSLDVSSRTSVVLTKIIFREFLGFEPEWRDSTPNLNSMLEESDCALLIGDPALSIAESGMRNAESDLRSKTQRENTRDLWASNLKYFDLAELWHRFTGLGFVFAMWMTRRETLGIDLAAARDEGLNHLDEIAANYTSKLHINKDEMLRYLSENISYSVDDSMGKGLELYLKLAAKLELIPVRRPLAFSSTRY